MKWPLIFLLILAVTSASATPITIVGLDHKGRELQTTIQQKEYQKILDYELKEVDSILTESEKTAPVLKTGLQLKTVIVGLGMSGKIGLGPFQLGAAIHHHLYFEILR